MVICSFITTKGIDGLIKVKGMHHGIPFLLEENSILQIPISSNNPSTSRGTLRTPL